MSFYLNGKQKGVYFFSVADQLKLSRTNIKQSFELQLLSKTVLILY